MTAIRRIPVAFLLALPLAFAACGGDGDSDEDQIRSILDDGAETPVTICDNLAKPALDQIGGLDACKKAGAGEKSDGELTINDVKVDGAKATARVKDDDGDQTVNFVKEGDDWKVAIP